MCKVYRYSIAIYMRKLYSNGFACVCVLGRYGLIENKKDKFNLYTVSIPVKRSSSAPSPCYIMLWDKENFKVKKRTSAGTEVLSALSVR